MATLLAQLEAEDKVLAQEVQIANEQRASLRRELNQAAASVGLTAERAVTVAATNNLFLLQNNTSGSSGSSSGDRNLSDLDSGNVTTALAYVTTQAQAQVSEVSQAMQLRKITDEDLAKVSAVATRLASEFRKRDQDAQQTKKRDADLRRLEDYSKDVVDVASSSSSKASLPAPPLATSVFSLFGGRMPQKKTLSSSSSSSPPPAPPPAALTPPRTPQPKDGLAALYEAFGLTGSVKKKGDDEVKKPKPTTRGKK